MGGFTEAADPKEGELTVGTEVSWVCESMLVILLNSDITAKKEGGIISREIQCKRSKEKKTNEFSVTKYTPRKIKKKYIFF